jgi:hypothetical protein
LAMAGRARLAERAASFRQLNRQRAAFIFFLHGDWQNLGRR